LGGAIEAIRLRTLFGAQGIQVSLAKGFRVVAIGTFFNFCIPGGTGGDVMKLYYLAKDHRGKGIEVGTVLLVDRIVALFSLLIFIVSLAVLDWHLIHTMTTVRWFIGVAVIGILVLVLFSALVWGHPSWVKYLMEKIQNWIPCRDLFRRAATAFLNFKSHKLIVLKAATWSFGGHILLAIMFAVSGAILIPEGTPFTISLLALLAMFANTLPITPGGLGVGGAAYFTSF